MYYFLRDRNFLISSSTIASAFFPFSISSYLFRTARKTASLSGSSLTRSSDIMSSFSGGGGVDNKIGSGISTGGSGSSGGDVCFFVSGKIFLGASGAFLAGSAAFLVGSSLFAAAALFFFATASFNLDNPLPAIFSPDYFLFFFAGFFVVTRFFTRVFGAFMIGSERAEASFCFRTSAWNLESSSVAT